MFRAIMFDLDGTLWNATGCATMLWNSVFKKYSETSTLMTPEKVSGLMGKTMEEIGEALFPAYTREKRMQIVNDYGDEEVTYLYKNGAILYKGVEEVLAVLSRHYDLYIVSNCQDGYISAFLHAHQLGCYFKDYEMSGRTGLDKGNNIRLLMEKNHIVNAVYVGDTEGDEKAARFAGIPFIWAKYGFGNAVAPDAVIESITDLPEIISGLKLF